MQPRTKRQREVLDYITLFVTERGFGPSYQQIARAIGVRSKGAVAKHIEALERQGLISRRHDEGGFAIDLLPEESLSDSACRIEWLEIPESESDQEPESLIVSKSLVADSHIDALRAYRVGSDAMTGDGIAEGDIAIVEEKSFARDRDIIVAKVGDSETVIRKYYRRGADVELRASNESVEPIIAGADQIEVLAVFRGLIRPVS